MAEIKIANCMADTCVQERIAGAIERVLSPEFDDARYEVLIEVLESIADTFEFYDHDFNRVRFYSHCGLSREDHPT